MSSVKKRVSEDRRVWERLLSFFPGYRGYKDKELLREIDNLVREGIFHKGTKTGSVFVIG